MQKTDSRNSSDAKYSTDLNQKNQSVCVCGKSYHVRNKPNNRKWTQTKRDEISNLQPSVPIANRPK